MSWVWAALMPHPPIIVPEIGRGREREATATLSGVERLIEKIGDRMPDRLFLLSPHQPYQPGSLFLNDSPASSGDFGAFGVSSIHIGVETPRDAVMELAAHLRPNRISTYLGNAADLSEDQGATVPLYFLRKAWGYLPPTVLASPIGLDFPTAHKLGQTLAHFSAREKWALLASGDLSHRLKPGAPAGYSPCGKEFDSAVVEAIETCNSGVLIRMPGSTIEKAGECGLRSVLAFLGFCEKLGARPKMLSYEGPFGVGYCNAIWAEE